MRLLPRTPLVRGFLPSSEPSSIGRKRAGGLILAHDWRAEDGAGARRNRGTGKREQGRPRTGLSVREPADEPCASGEVGGQPAGQPGQRSLARADPGGSGRRGRAPGHRGGTRLGDTFRPRSPALSPPVCSGRLERHPLPRVGAGSFSRPGEERAAAHRALHQTGCHPLGVDACLAAKDEGAGPDKPTGEQQ